MGEIIEPRLREILPPDAAEYASNYRFCLHWSGEEPYDSSRAEEIAEGIKESCTGLEEARDSLRRRYRPGSPVDRLLRRVIADVDSNSYEYVWDDPANKSIVLNRYYESSGQGALARVRTLIAQRRALSDTSSAATKSALAWMVKVETGGLAELMANIDRLHPETAKEVREARVRWERETGEKVDIRRPSRGYAR